MQHDHTQRVEGCYRWELDPSESPALLEKRHPGFVVTCKKCGSNQGYVDNSVKWRDDGGAWGAVDLVCGVCRNSVRVFEMN